MSHSCSSIIFHCMDFRLINAIRRWMQEQKLIDNCDVISIAGASKIIVDGNEIQRNVFLDQIDISCRLHASKNVILLHHSDCGAYKNSYDFSSPEEEKKKQLEDMVLAEKIIKERFPSVEVIKIWAQMNDFDGINIEFHKID